MKENECGCGRKIIGSYFSQGKMNSAQVEGFNYILDATKNITNAGDLSVVLNAFNAFLLGRNDMTKIEKAPVYLAGQIAFASAFYWNHAFANPQSPWYARLHENFTDATLYKIKWWDLIAAGVNCIGCGVAGGPAGCIGCASLSAPLASSIAGEK